MFFNITNHPQAQWSKNQREAAQSLGGKKIIDSNFPNVDPRWDSSTLGQLAYDMMENNYPDARPGDTFLIQGEMGLTYLLVSALKKHGYLVVHACSERNVIETISPSGETIKKSVFQFIQFREY